MVNLRTYSKNASRVNKFGDFPFASDSMKSFSHCVSFSMDSRNRGSFNWIPLFSMVCCKRKKKINEKNRNNKNKKWDIYRIKKYIIEHSETCAYNSNRSDEKKWPTIGLTPIQRQRNFWQPFTSDFHLQVALNSSSTVQTSFIQTLLQS